MTTDTYRIGWRSSAHALARCFYARPIGWRDRLRAVRWATRRLRYDLHRLAAGGHRCGGWHAEPVPLPRGLAKIGCAWTRRGALRDLNRHIAAIPA